MTVSPYDGMSLNLSSVLPQLSPVPRGTSSHFIGHPSPTCSKAVSFAWILTTCGLVINSTDLAARQTQL